MNQLVREVIEWCSETPIAMSPVTVKGDLAVISGEECLSSPGRCLEAGAGIAAAIARRWWSVVW
jgi:hypothetical protein